MYHAVDLQVSIFNHARAHNTHTHTHIYIYIYIYVGSKEALLNFGGVIDSYQCSK